MFINLLIDIKLAYFFKKGKKLNIIIYIFTNFCSALFLSIN